MKMNNIFIKLLVSILIVLTLVNFISSTNIGINYSYADEEGEARANELINESTNNFGDIILNVLKSIVLAPFRAARSLNYLLASSGGTTSGVQSGEISPFDIFFNRFTLLDANIFSTTDRDGNPLDTDSLVYKIRTNAAVWYYAIRTLAIAIIAIMLIWNLIKSISKNTSAEQKVVAKNSLTDWVLSFALVMFMHIIVIIVLNFNDILLDTIQGFTPYANTADFFDALENAVFSSNLMLGIASLLVYALLNWQTLKYILIYIQRLLTIVLLIMISPLVPVTYSTDRMRGGRGAALNGWLKELLFNVFIQVLHALVYAALVGVAMSALTSQSSITGLKDIGSALVAIAAMLFIKYAERVVKTIFGFDSSQVLNNNVFSEAVTNVGNAAVTASRIGNRIAMGGVGAAGVGIGGARLGNGISFGQNIGNAASGTPSLGQLFQGVGTGIRNASSSVMDGIRGLGNTPQGQRNGNGGYISNLLNSVTGRGQDGADGENASAYADSNASASASAEAIAQDGENGQDGQDAVVAEPVMGGADVGQEDKDLRQDAKDKALQEQLNQMKDDNENNTATDKAMDKLKDAVNKSANNKDNQEKGTVTNEHINEKNVTEEETKTETNIETTTESVEGEVPAGNEIPIEATGGNSQELLDELKEGIKAIQDEDTKKLEDIATSIDKQLIEIGSKLDEKTKEDIEKNVESLIRDPKALSEYIKSLPEGSNERNYAEAYARFNSVMDASDENITGQMSNEDRAQMLMNTYGAQGLNIPDKLKPEDVSRLKVVPPKDGIIKSEDVEVKADEKTKVDLNNNEINDKMNKTTSEAAEEALNEALEAFQKVGIDVENVEQLEELVQLYTKKTEENPAIKTAESSSNTAYAFNQAGKAVDLINKAKKEGFTVFEGSIETRDSNGNKRIDKISRTSNEAEVIQKLRDSRNRAASSTQQNGKVVNIDDAIEARRRKNTKTA